MLPSDDRKRVKLFLTIFGVIACVSLSIAVFDLVRPFTPDGTVAGTQAIEKYEAIQCDGGITVLSSRKVVRKYSEGSWYESWKIKNACDEIHTFLIRFGVSPDVKTFVIEFDLVE